MSSVRRVYLDNNATTPVDPRVLEEMLPYFNEKFGNAASRNHAFGWEAEESVQHAREQVAHVIGANPKEIIFTSGATESNNLAIKGVAQRNAENGNHIITCSTEHKAVLDPANRLQESGLDVTYLNVNSEGLIDLAELERAITDQTILITIMYANNETGVIQPIEEISQVAKRHNVIFMTDATQAVGKIPVDVKNLDVDLMSFSSHKLYGPKGVGVLYVRSKVKLAAQIEGGGHERGMRSGTLNVPGIVGMGKACELCSSEMQEEERRLRPLRDKLEEAVLKISRTNRNGHSSERLAHVSNISLEDVDGEKLLLSLHEIAVSQGSACTSATFEPSHVLRAMGISDELAFSTLRFGLGRFTTEEEIDFVIEKIEMAVSQLRK
ncbi:MAG: IscS subfamily cysteine desulfurase [Cyclobacteriaceae bacterium]